MYSQEQLSHLLHTESLKQAFHAHRQSSALTEQVAVEVKGGKIQIEKDAAFVEEVEPTWAQQSFSSSLASAASLDELFEYLRHDVFTIRDKLLTLNTSRRELVEKRLEYIARKLANVRNERLSRTIALPEILRESFRSGVKDKTFGQLALEGFAAEVALYQILQLFLLKSLDISGLRPFTSDDLGRLNFAIHGFLSQKTLGFTQDRCSWNFIRPNVYSWYTLSSVSMKHIETLLNKVQCQWTNAELMSWIHNKLHSMGLDHLEISNDLPMAQTLWQFIEEDLGLPLVTHFQGHQMGRKVFFPNLDNGGFALQALDQLLKQYSPCTKSFSTANFNMDQCLHNSLWACDTEGLEVFYTEVFTLLKLIQATMTTRTHSLTSSEFLRLPHGIRITQRYGLELHNLEQLPLEGLRTYEGTAGLIQQFETFDLAVVLDHPDRAKSARWLKALSEKIPYWRSLLGASTNLNWGELHLALAVQKLKEQGHCLYLSHRVLPEGGDGERLRRMLLGNCTLDYFFELPETFGPYRYLYILTRETSKTLRDNHRIRFGKWLLEHRSLSHMLEHRIIEESASTQWEVAERGWDQIFVRGAAPLVRHLNHKFPKLFQLATVQYWSDGKDSKQTLFGNKQITALEVKREQNKISFTPVTNSQPQERLVIYPHNPSDLPWLESLLNSAPVQFWLKIQLTQTDFGPLKAQDLRSLPIIDLTLVPAEVTAQALQWLGQTKPDAAALTQWMVDINGREPSAKAAAYVALAKRRSQLVQSAQRYRGLFDSFEADHFELNPDTITQFYPASLLTPLLQCPEVKTHYVGRELTTAQSNLWILQDVLISPVRNLGPTHMTITVQTRQGPRLQFSTPRGYAPYLSAQLKRLRNYTWGEAMAVLKAPKNIPLFSAQTSEIVRVIHQVIADVELYDKTLAQMSLDLFEISTNDRQYL